MYYVDLHVHSNASDGTFSPKQVVKAANQAGLTAIALTDHDTTDGVAEAVLAAENTPLELIPGTELSCVYRGTEIHILGLFIDWTDPVLTASLHELRATRGRRNDIMLERLQEAGFDITLEDLKGGSPDTVITRAHFARVLTEKGYTKDRSTAFRKYLSEGCPFYVPKEELSPERAMELLCHAGAFPVLAHPMQYHLCYDQVEELLLLLSSLGLKGLEVYHPSSNQYQSGKLLSMARRLGLSPTGGSDFHGSNKPDIKLGVGRGSLRVPLALLEELKARR